MTEREPYIPTAEEWPDVWQMLCGHCTHMASCEIIEGMIETKNGGAWPAGGWVTDPGAVVTCLSYEPRAMRPVKREQLRRILRDPPPMCSGCAAQKGSEASVSLHTRRDFAAAVENRALFLCHEDPEMKRPCGGWCQAIQHKERRRTR